VGRGSKALPLIILCYDATDVLSVAMWKDPASLADFVKQAPLGVSYLFLSYSNSSERVMCGG